MAFYEYLKTVQDRQCLKWKIRGEGTVRQLLASKQAVLAPDRFLLSLRCGNAGSQYGGAGTAFPCVQRHFNH